MFTHSQVHTQTHKGRSSTLKSHWGLFGDLLLEVKQELVIWQSRLRPVLDHVLHEAGFPLALVPGRWQWQGQGEKSETVTSDFSCNQHKHCWYTLEKKQTITAGFNSFVYILTMATMTAVMEWWLKETFWTSAAQITASQCAMIWKQDSAPSQTMSCSTITKGKNQILTTYIVFVLQRKLSVHKLKRSLSCSSVLMVI